jgi:hypothetical protein
VQERSHRHIARSNEIRMKALLAILTDEEQPVVGTVLRAGLPTLGTSLAAVVRIDLHGHTLMQQGFIGDHTLQFGKAPLGVGRIGFSLLLARLFALLADASLADVGQVFQADEAMWVLLCKERPFLPMPARAGEEWAILLNFSR